MSTQNSDLPDFRIGQRPHHPQQCRAADRRADQAGYASAPAIEVTVRRAIATVYASREQFARRARSLGHHGPRRDQHGTVGVRGLQNVQIPEDGAEQEMAAGILARRGMQHNEPHGALLMTRF